MVSAATGALLISHLPAGQPRLSLLLACYAMFGISLVASMVVITQLWQRLVRHSIGPAAMVPTLWIVLGPLGQSITAAGLYLILVAAWAVVSVRTVAGTWRGGLLRAAAPTVPAGAGLTAAGEVPADEVAELTLTGEGITARPA